MTEISEPLRVERRLGMEVTFGRVVVTEQVVGYQRKSIRDQSTIDLVGFDVEFDLARAVKSDAEVVSVRDSVRINERGFEIFEGWVEDTVRMLAGCPCEHGCPSCVQSPKCGNLNEPLDKHGALSFLGRLVDFPSARSS
jgi:hypothetical protein